MVTRTRHFRFGIPDFDVSTWHGDFATLVNALDATAYAVFIAAGATAWANATVYAIGDIALDSTDGSIWVVDVAHTSAVSPTTFAQDRTTHSTYWTTLTPDAAAVDSAIEANLSARQASGFAAQASDAQRKSLRVINNANMVVANATAGAGALVHKAHSIVQQAINAVTAASAAAGFSSMAAQARRQARASAISATASAASAAASAAALTDDQIMLRSQVFGN